MTELEIVSAVMNVVTSHEGVTTTSLDVDQVASEIDTLRARMISELDKSSLFRRPYQGFTQTIKSVAVTNGLATVPNMIMLRHHYPAFIYIGGKDGESPYRVITGDFKNAMKDPFISKMPIARYQEGILEFRNITPNQVRVVAVFEDPSALAILNEYDDETSRYPMPAGMVDEIIGKTTESYLRTMYRISPQPNTQSDLVNAGRKV